MPRVDCDSLKSIRPIVTAPGIDFDVLIGDMNLRPIAVELDLMNPARAARDMTG